MTNESAGGTPVQHILICGSGLAAHVTAAALSHQLPPAIRITLAGPADAPAADLFYGTVAGPTAYAFNRAAGLSEPRLVLESDAAFSWGTKYDHWADGGRSWIQSFELPFPVLGGVMFHHYLAQQGVDQLERFLVSAAAARKGGFAHPPNQTAQKAQGPQHLFSRSEYGYQFDPASYGQLFKASTNAGRVRTVDAELLEVVRGTGGITGLRMSNGETLTADVYVDCTGLEGALLSALGSEFSGERELGAMMRGSAATTLGPAMRTVAPTDYGWRAETPLQGRSISLAVYHPDSEADVVGAAGEDGARQARATIGRRDQAWSDNCVGIGHAAGVIEPLTPAPILLLERDIERLVSLIPFSSDMQVESREYNRRSAEDYEHASLFNRSLFATEPVRNTPYWSAARAEPVDEKLARKLELFQDRGLLAAYDLEPFHPEDWTILHYGMGRTPRRYDRSADRAPSGQVQQFLSAMKRDVEKLVEAMPSHASYMAELHRHLTRNRR